MKPILARSGNIMWVSKWGPSVSTLAVSTSITGITMCGLPMDSALKLISAPSNSVVYRSCGFDA